MQTQGKRIRRCGNSPLDYWRRVWCFLAVLIDPIELIQHWRDEASKAGELDPDAMALATATKDGHPSVRIVLFRGVRRGRICFFTNYQSRKGHELDTNPRAALAIHYPSLSRQIRVEGPVERLLPAESDDYFASRPRGHQVGAWASDQSRTIPSLEVVRARVSEQEARFEGIPVARPPYWGGYGILPEKIELWTAGLDRIHDRRLFTRAPGGEWVESRLSP